MSAGDLHAPHPVCSLLNRHCPPPPFSAVYWDSAADTTGQPPPPPPPQQTGTLVTSGFGLSLLVSPDLRIHSEMSREKTQPTHTSGPEYLNDVVHETSRPFYQHPGLAPQDRLVHSWDSFWSEVISKSFIFREDKPIPSQLPLSPGETHSKK